MKPLCDKFESLFRKLYNVEKNRDCLNKFLILFNRQNWDVLLKFIAYVQQRAIDLISFKMSKHEQGMLSNVMLLFMAICIMFIVVALEKYFNYTLSIFRGFKICKMER